MHHLRRGAFNRFKERTRVNRYKAERWDGGRECGERQVKLGEACPGQYCGNLLESMKVTLMRTSSNGG